MGQNQKENRRATTVFSEAWSGPREHANCEFSFHFDRPRPDQKFLTRKIQRGSSTEKEEEEKKQEEELRGGGRRARERGERREGEGRREKREQGGEKRGQCASGL